MRLITRSQRLAAAAVIDARNEAPALPDLAMPIPESFLRSLDRSMVVIRVDPFGGCDLPRAIEAVEPV